MNKNLFIKRFEIKELFGIYNVNIPFSDNINIFVGENGLGKTTILNALNYIIQGDSDSLATIDFKEIYLTLGDNSKIEIIHDDLIDNTISIHNRNRFYHYPSDDDYGIVGKRMMLEILKNKEFKSVDDRSFKESIFENVARKYKYDVSMSILDKIYSSISKDKAFEKKIMESWEYKIDCYMKNWNKIIYLPTYRRIEEDFNSYIENSPDEYYRRDKRKRNFSYLQFGMDDVQESIDFACNTLKDNTNEGFKAMTSNLLTNFINISEKNNMKYDYENFDATTLDIVFSRLADKIDPQVKNQIIGMIDKNDNPNDNFHQYLFSIIKELTNIYEKNKAIDDNLENFKNVCNNYLTNKNVEYDKFRIECNVIQKNTKKPILLKNLSSGEKQIISLFSKLYLNMEQKNIVLFDEPELSLSIIWQKRLVPDIINSDRCGFIAIITHSPFIFDNNFREKAIDIREYIDNVD